jgi:hypothetical protein
MVNANRARSARLPAERESTPRAKERASAAVVERSVTPIGEAHREHARRLARAIDKQGGA